MSLCSDQSYLTSLHNKIVNIKHSVEINHITVKVKKKE